MRKFRFKNRFRCPGEDFQRVVPVQQHGPDGVVGQAAVAHAVVEHQPAAVGEDGRRAAADLLFLGAAPALDEDVVLGPFPVEQVVRELDPDGREFRLLRVFRPMQHRKPPADLFREQDHVPVVLDGRSQAAQAPEGAEVAGAGQAGVAQVLLPRQRRVLVRVRLEDHVVREGPVASGRERPVRVRDVEGVTELDNAGILHAAAVRAVRARAEDRLRARPVEMESVGAGGQPEADHVFLIVPRGAVQHVEHAAIQDDARIARHQVLPRVRGIRREDGVTTESLQFHYLKMNNRIRLNTMRPPPRTR